MAKQGCILSEIEIRRIINLLSATDMTFSEIAGQLSCSCSTVVALNRKFQVRSYAGLQRAGFLKTERVT
jgi:hypothetical protein